MGNFNMKRLSGDPGYHIVLQCTSGPKQSETMGADWVTEKGNVLVSNLMCHCRAPIGVRGTGGTPDDSAQSAQTDAGGGSASGGNFRGALFYCHARARARRHRRARRAVARAEAAGTGRLVPARLHRKRLALAAIVAAIM
jgi:hypothetical protein